MARLRSLITRNQQRLAHVRETLSTVSERLDRKDHLPVILLVEDDPDDVHLLQEALLEISYSCDLRVAGDGASAIEYLLGGGQFADRNRFPIPKFIILDLNLPKQSGFEVLAALNEGINLHIPVLVLSGSRRTEDRTRALAMGVEAFMSKPEDFQSLVEVCNAIRKRLLYGKANVNASFSA